MLETPGEDGGTARCEAGLSCDRCAAIGYGISSLFELIQASRAYRTRQNTGSDRFTADATADQEFFGG